MRDTDETFMRAALVQAAKAAGKTSPNPAVGAVFVADGKIVARGHHRAAGAAHAEIECLSKLGRRVASDGTLYVTLEPCSTHGRTPPCTDALISAGVRNVVIGTVDPNHGHSGRAIEILKRAGIDVRSGVLAHECAVLNRPFNKWIRTGRPYVIAKCGMSLDGHLTKPKTDSRWITSSASRRHANAKRGMVDAILVGAATVRIDNPRLTVRETKHARQPWRVVLSRSGTLPRTAHLLTDKHADRTLIFREDSFDSVLVQLGQREITSVLIEGGGEILAQALDQRLIDRIELYLGAMFTGGPVLTFGGEGAASTADAIKLHEVRYEQIGDDVFVSGEVAHQVAETG